MEQELLSQSDLLILTVFGGYQVGITKIYMGYNSMTLQFDQCVRNFENFGEVETTDTCISMLS